MKALILGDAGTGKSQIIYILKKEFGNKIIVTATTGFAAFNI